MTNDELKAMTKNQAVRHQNGRIYVLSTADETGAWFVELRNGRWFGPMRPLRLASIERTPEHDAVNL